MKKLFSLFMMILLMSISFGENGIKKSENENVVTVDKNMKKMNDAIKKANRELPFFIKNYQNPKADQTYFSIKVALTADGYTEHIWLNKFQFDKKPYTGHLSNNPYYIKSVKFGDKIEFKKMDVSDWMIVQDGKLIGGYTIRVIRDAMSEEDRKKFDESFKIIID